MFFSILSGHQDQTLIIDFRALLINRYFRCTRRCHALISFWKCFIPLLFFIQWINIMHANDSGPYLFRKSFVMRDNDHGHLFF